MRGGERNPSDPWRMINHSRTNIASRRRKKKGKKEKKYTYFLSEIPTGGGSVPDEGERLAGAAEEDADLRADGHALQPLHSGHAASPDHHGRAWAGRGHSVSSGDAYTGRCLL